MSQDQQQSNAKQNKYRQLGNIQQMVKPYVYNDFARRQGKTQQVLQGQSIQVRKQQDVRPICPISHTAIPKTKLYVADCLHAFHRDAIREYVESYHRLTCPVCRRRSIGFMVQDEYILGNRHINPEGSGKGGWIADTAKVASTAIIRPNAKVYGTVMHEYMVMQKSQIMYKCMTMLVCMVMHISWMMRECMAMQKSMDMQQCNMMHKYLKMRESMKTPIYQENPKCMEMQKYLEMQY